MSKIRVMLSGTGGYGDGYLQRMFQRADEGTIEIAGLVEPFPAACKRLDAISERGIRMYDSLDAFYAENSCELAVICTPIQYHTTQILTALAHGSNVLVEKPLSGDARDIETLIEARERTGKFIMVGFQWSHSDAILAMKRDILAGVWGKPELLKTLVLWPRNKAYFNRGSGWAGKIKAADGTLILDSVAHNATAHYLHNIFFTLGGALDESAAPTAFKAQLYRTNPIETFDTALISCEFASGAKALYIASHSTDKTLNPIFEYRFENGVIVFDEGADKVKHIIGKKNDGTVIDYGDPFSDQLNKFDYAVSNVTADEKFIPCGVETASVQLRCIAECAKLPIVDFPEDRKHVIGDGFTCIDGLYEELCECYRGEHMLGE